MKSFLLLVMFLLLLLKSEAQNTGQGISLLQTPDDGMVSPGRDATFTCTVDLNILPQNTLIVWSRHVGTLHTKIAVGTIKQDDFLSNNRYKLSTSSGQANKQHFTLTISDVHFEDTGTIECAILHSSRRDSKVLAVCDDPSSESCRCVKQTGWASAECFGESKSVRDLQKAFDRTVTGLGVCFAIAVIYSIVVTVFFARDCMKVIYRQNQLKIAKIKNQQQGYNPYVDSDKVTVEDDLGSIPESGVWSQSDGRNGSDRSTARGPPLRIVQNQVKEERPIQERPVATQSHTNPAFNPDDVSRTPGYDTVVGMVTKPVGGVRPKIPQQGTYPLPESAPYPPEAPHVENGTPYKYPEQQTVQAELYSPPPQGCLYPDPLPPMINQPVAAHYHGNQEYPLAPSSAQSERCMPPERPPPPQRSYTDVPAEKKPSAYSNGYTSPRRLEFGLSSGAHPAASAGYVDDHDTEI